MPYKSAAKLQTEFRKSYESEELDLEDGFESVTYVKKEDQQQCKMFYNPNLKMFKLVTSQHVSMFPPTQEIGYFKNHMDWKPGDKIQWPTQLHRTDGPAVVKRYLGTGSLIELGWFIDGQAHRDEQKGPQKLLFSFGIISQAIFAHNGKIGRTKDLPSMYEFSLGPDLAKPVRIVSVGWYKDGRLDRKNLPAIIVYHIESATYSHYKDGDLHRLDGPAIFTMNFGEKKAINPVWYVNGQQVDPDCYPVVSKGKIVNGMFLDRGMILDVTMFDREYGKFLLELSKNGMQH